MGSEMILHIAVCSPSFVTLRALVGLLSRVYSDVVSEGARSGEGFTTQRTSVRSDTLMSLEMSEEVFVLVKSLMTHFTRVHNAFTLLG